MPHTWIKSNSVTCERRTTDNRGKVHEIEVRIYGSHSHSAPFFWGEEAGSRSALQLHVPWPALRASASGLSRFPPPTASPISACPPASGTRGTLGAGACHRDRVPPLR